MARYANTGEFNVLYPTRTKMATILKRIVDSKLGEYSEGTLVDSIRINAKITGFQKLEILFTNLVLIKFTPLQAI